ncbi:MAG: hypothetical protein PHQ40_17415, partial [Anaerolineaceae bacterium]|nr:hypothetical protein [Anaerolineaceae bacterium]
MLTKFVRFVASLAVIVGFAGNTGVVHASSSTLPSADLQNREPLHASHPLPLDIPTLNLPPASSLGVQFVHVATAANTAWDTTTIDHPLTNGMPGAHIFITPNFTPGGVGGVNNGHPTGVKYAGGKWMIFNQDGTQIPAGAAFNVIIPNSDTNVFVHTTPSNNVGKVTYMNNPLTNGQPNAIVFVTLNYDPGGVCGACVTDNHPIGVGYLAENANMWGIFNQDGTDMPVGASFNVFVLSAGAGVFVHTTTAGNRANDHTYIDNPLTNGNPNAIVFVT